ncbi:MAG TPA: glycosyltransferase family 39 protein [Polyangiaceae bacterium]|jgi:hypothetical protein|nr:glycosyltransferase family 39 protein [Polyangiaceae bacterium]
MRNARLIAWSLCIAKVAVHIALIDRYGYHRDELYFIACGERLALGYVDHPPLVPWIAALAGLLFDHSLFGLRILPALAGGATVLLTTCLVRELGGGPRAVLLAGLAVVIPPAFLRMGKILCIPVFEPLFWTLASLLVVRIVHGHKKQLWLAVGLVVGMGLLNKHSMLLWVAGMGVGLVATPLRRELRSPMPWLGLALAFAVVAPNLWWQAQNGWATVVFLRSMSAHLLARVPASLFLLGQILYMHPLTLPVWLGGLAFFFTHARYRALGWSFLVVIAALLITGAKPYYAAPAYPVLFAGGGVALERLFAGRRWAHSLSVATMSAGGLALGFMSVPVLDVQRIDAVLGTTLGWIVDPNELTRELHDEHGWREQAAAVMRVYGELPARERAVAVVLTGNYGQASAVNFFRSDREPPAVSGHMSYHLWGIDADRGDVAIAYGLPRARLSELYDDVQEVAQIDHPLAMPQERHLPLYVCRRPSVPLARAWPSLRRYVH